jgi:transaldolase
VVISPPYSWQVKLNKSGIKPDLNSIDKPVPAEILNPLLENFEEFRKAYNEDGLKPSEFSTYGATVRTLRGFLQSTNDLESLVRDVLNPNPDK